MLTARERGSSTIVAEKMATKVWANVEEEWMKKRKGILLDLEVEEVHQICCFMWADNF